MASDHWQLPGVAQFVALACAALHRGLLLSFNMFQLILEQVHICHVNQPHFKGLKTCWSNLNTC